MLPLQIGPHILPLKQLSTHLKSIRALQSQQREVGLGDISQDIRKTLENKNEMDKLESQRQTVMLTFLSDIYLVKSFYRGRRDIQRSLSVVQPVCRLGPPLQSRRDRQNQHRARTSQCIVVLLHHILPL